MGDDCCGWFGTGSLLEEEIVVSGQWLAVSSQRSAVSDQRSAIGCQLTVYSRQFTLRQL